MNRIKTGEWVRKLYDGDESARRIPCFDIELSNNYRDGTRGKEGKEKTDGPNMMYYSNNVINRNNLRFFKKKNNDKIDGRFADISGNIIYTFGNEGEGEKNKEISISFFEFLEEYFDLRNMIIKRFIS